MIAHVNDRRRDYIGGVLLLLIGLAAAIGGTAYPTGTLARIGPGFFPIALGTILALIGLYLIGAAAASAPVARGAVLAPEWRGWICIAAGIIAFIVLGKYGGLLPAAFAIVFLSALGDRQNSFRSAFVLALVMSLVVSLTFVKLLGLQFPLFAWG